MISWISFYYVEVMKIDESLVGIYSCVPYFFCIITSIVFGKIADKISKNMPIVRVRKMFQAVSFLGPSFAFFILCVSTELTNTTKMILIW